VTSGWHDRSVHGAHTGGGSLFGVLLARHDCAIQGPAWTDLRPVPAGGASYRTNRGGPRARFGSATVTPTGTPSAELEPVALRGPVPSGRPIRGIVRSLISGLVIRTSRSSCMVERRLLLATLSDWSTYSESCYQPSWRRNDHPPTYPTEK